MRGQRQRRQTRRDGGRRPGGLGGHGLQSHGLDPPPPRAGRLDAVLLSRAPEAVNVLDARGISAAKANAGLRRGRLVDGGTGVAGAAGGIAADDVAVLQAALAAANAALKWGKKHGLTD